LKIQVVPFEIIGIFSHEVSTMKCPKCQFENPEGAKFCNECGHRLEEVAEAGKSVPAFKGEKSI
jgi:rRNA maturation endonuclease Nob1